MSTPKSPAPLPPISPSSADVREEITKQLQDPPASFVSLIENEVEKRIAVRVNQYKILAGVVVVFLSLLGWSISSDIRKQISESGLKEAKLSAERATKEIERNRDSTDLIIRYIDNTARKVGGIFEQTSNRLVQLKNNDRLALVDDVQKFYVFQKISEIPPDGKIVLDFEPIVASIRILITDQAFAPLFVTPRVAKIESNVLILAPGSFSGWQQSAKKGEFGVEYFRKSLR